jgi:nucleotide-binding universal stress UspA family protein
MKSIDTILACIDLSEYSFMTLELALELSRGTGRQVIALNVINQRDIACVQTVERYYPDKINADEYIRELKKERSNRLKQFIKENFFDEKSRIRLEIDTGIPHERILDAAHKNNAQVIIMANKGRGNLSRFLFGSAAEKVFRHSPVPVISVRDRQTFKRESLEKEQ